MVDIYVGPSRRGFHLHRDIICDRSSYFKAAFLRDFAEADTKELYLEEDNEIAFEIFANWLYGTTPNVPENEEQLPAYLALFVMAQKYVLEYLANLVIDLIRAYYRKTKALVRAQDLAYIYEHAGSQHLSSLMTEAAALQTNHQRIDVYLPGYRELMMRGGTFAADFGYWLLRYADERGRETKSSLHWLFAVRTSCCFHTHHDSPKCRGGNGEINENAEECEIRQRNILAKLSESKGT